MFNTPGNSQATWNGAFGGGKDAEPTRVYVDPMGFSNALPNAKDFTLVRTQQLAKSMNSLEIDSRPGWSKLF